MPVISFMTANFVARQTNYQIKDWAEGDAATQAHFEPLTSYRERLAEIFQEIATLTFHAVDIWSAYLHPRWASPEHLAMMAELLDTYQLKPVSFAGWWENLEDLEAGCRIAQHLGIKILSGAVPILRQERQAILRLMESYDLYLAWENENERSLAEMLLMLGEYHTRLGICLDTGWLGTYGLNAAEIVQGLAARLLHLHLKDVKAFGRHDSCRYGQGVVDIAGIVHSLKTINYQGGITVELEAYDRNPLEDVKTSYALLQQYLAD